MNIIVQPQGNFILLDSFLSMHLQIFLLLSYSFCISFCNSLLRGDPFGKIAIVQEGNEKSSLSGIIQKNENVGIWITNRENIEVDSKINIENNENGNFEIENMRNMNSTAVINFSKNNNLTARAEFSMMKNSKIKMDIVNTTNSSFSFNIKKLNDSFLTFKILNLKNKRFNYVNNGNAETNSTVIFEASPNE